MDKISKWIKEHEETIKTVGLIGVGCVIGGIAMREYTIMANLAEILSLANKGALKFFDPATGLEIAATQLADVVK